MGVGRAAVHPVLLTDAHLNFDLCVVGQRGHPRISDEQRELVVGFLQTVQKHDLGVCSCGGGGHTEEEGRLAEWMYNTPPILIVLSIYSAFCINTAQQQLHIMQSRAK